MRFTDFPLALDRRGWLRQAANPEDALIKLLTAMVATPERGWTGSKTFGLRESLTALHTKEGARLTVIQQVNQSFQDLGIDWVKVTGIEAERGNESEGQSFYFTLAYEGRGVVTHRVALR